MITHAFTRIKKESGETILEERFATELQAQHHFDELEAIRWPMTYEGLILNLSEYPEGRIGSVDLVAVNQNGREFCRRTLYRKP